MDDQDKGKSLDPFQQTLLQSIEVLQRSVNIINTYQEHIVKRLDDLDNRVQQTNFESAVPDPPLGRITSSVSAHVQTKPEQGLDVQREYECIKDSLTKVKLPNELKLLDNKLGIKREDQQHLTSISKSARYTETCLKLLSTFDDKRVTIEDLSSLYTVLVAHINSLQSDFTGLVVKGQFDK